MQRRAFLAASMAAAVAPSAATARDYVPACTVGTTLRYDPRNIHFEVLVVADGAKANSAATGPNPERAYQYMFDVVGRYFGPMTVTWFFNMNPDRFPSRETPYLIGNGYCMGRTPILSDGPGWCKASVSTIARSKSRATGGPVVNGQVCLVLPREPLRRFRSQTGLSPVVAVNVNIHTVYNPVIRAGDRFAGLPSTKITQSRNGVTHLEDLVNQGSPNSRTYFVYRGP